MPTEPFIKVCGVREPNVLTAAVEAGAHAVGLNFVPQSRRSITLEVARHLVDRGRQAHGRLPLLVGVFADADEAWIRQVRRELALDWVQLHGEEPPALVEALQPAYKAIRLGSKADLEALKPFPGALLLIDAQVPGRLGGTGRAIPLDLARAAARIRPVILAGGLNDRNVAAAIAAIRPAGVDTASGCEDGTGAPSADAARRFIRAAKAAFARQRGAIEEL